MTKCFIIGLDGASPIIFQWAKKGELPNIAKILEGGVSGVLNSTIPFFSTVAWASFLTGKNPGKTGFFGWTKRIPGTYDTRSLNSNDLYPASPLWKLLNDASKRGIFVGIPTTSPPHEIVGAMVGGLPAREITAYPPEVASKLKEIGFDVVVEKEESIEDYYHLNAKEAEAVFYLMKYYEWDFFIVNFQAHQHWLYRGMVLSQCQDLDNIVGKILDTLDKDTIVIIMSDHGTMPVYKDVNIATYLMQLGLLTPKTGLLVLFQKLQINIKSAIIQSNVTKFLRKAIRKLLLRTPFVYELAKRLSNTMLTRHSAKSLKASDIDWARTKAFSLEADSIFINLKGREPKGTINPGSEYEELRDYIIKKLLNLQDPYTATDVIARVYKKEEIYHGQYINQAPDLVIAPQPGYRLALWSSNESIISDTLRKTYQEEYGIFSIKGPEIKKGQEIEKAQIIDIMPTILHILGLTVPRDIDGKVLKEVFAEDGVLYKRPIKYREIEEKGRIRQTIKGLKFRGKI